VLVLSHGDGDAHVDEEVSAKEAVALLGCVRCDGFLGEADGAMDEEGLGEEEGGETGAGEESGEDGTGEKAEGGEVEGVRGG
jgi:hypothetical protein